MSGNTKTFDVIVVGIGSMGSSACYHLAKQGLSVLGIDQFEVPHERGSHSGQTRIIRKAYFEHPDYVPLLEAAYKNWSKIEEASGVQLYYKTGLAYFGQTGSSLISGVRKSAAKYSIQVNDLAPRELIDRFPSFSIPSNYERSFEPDAGFLNLEKAILTFLECAVKNGASLKTNEQFISYQENDAGIQVKTSKGTYGCEKLIITTGAWSGQLLPVLRSQINPTRQVIAWMKPKKSKEFELGQFPCWTIAHPEDRGIYYGFPILPEDQFDAPKGLKVGYHYPGQITDPNKVKRETSKEEENELIQFLNEFIPNGYESIISTKTCLYTNASDDNFIIDLHPENSNIVLATGFSGHGFKFASVVGEILSDLATKGKTDQSIGFLSLNRFH